MVTLTRWVQSTAEFSPVAQCSGATGSSGHSSMTGRRVTRPRDATPLCCATSLRFLLRLCTGLGVPALAFVAVRLTIVLAFAACGSPWASPFRPACGGSEIVPAISVALQGQRLGGVGHGETESRD